MLKQTTQFWVALILAAGLVGVTVLSFYRQDRELTMLLVGGLVAMAGSSGSWLFRLNGYASGQSDELKAARVLALTYPVKDAPEFKGPPWPAPPPSAN